MSSNEERTKILNMIKEGKLSVDEASQLLDALGKNDDESASPPPRAKPGAGTLRISVTETDTGKAKVNLTIPLKLAQLARSLIPESERTRIQEQGIDLDSLFSTLSEGTAGKILDVEDPNDNHRVEIWIE